jgi:prephenate dehydratase
VENTLGGTIYDTLDLLNLYPGIKVIGEQQVRIIHNLIVLPGSKLEDIKQVYSHPQGLAQCAAFLKKELPNAEIVPFFDTAGSVTYIKKCGDKSKAAIAGAPAARFHGMEILKEGIETNPSNYTRFYAICREENVEGYTLSQTPNRAVLSFSVDDRPGSLYEALHVLSQHKLNMKKLESRPILGKPWEYSFFVETEMVNEASFGEAVNELKQKCVSLRVNGTFLAG